MKLILIKQTLQLLVSSKNEGNPDSKNRIDNYNLMNIVDKGEYLILIEMPNEENKGEHSI